VPLENIVAEKIDLFNPCCHSVLLFLWIMASKTMCQKMKSINQFTKICHFVPVFKKFLLIWILSEK